MKNEIDFFMPVLPEPRKREPGAVIFLREFAEMWIVTMAVGFMLAGACLAALLGGALVYALCFSVA